MELAAAPMALFLDEPTSGLDATSALSVITTLKALSRLGITVITIIHQPRQEIFEALDSLILLANGRMIYQGKEDNVHRYFEQAGFIFARHQKYVLLQGLYLFSATSPLTFVSRLQTRRGDGYHYWRRPAL